MIEFLTQPMFLALYVFLIGYSLYALVFSRRDNKVHCYIWELIDGKAYLKSIKPTRGRMKKVDGVDKLRLPKRLSSREIRGLEINNFVPNQKGLRIVNLVRVSEDNYVCMSSDYDVQSSYNNLALIDNSNAFWAMNEMKEAELRNSQKDKLGWVKANIAAITMVVVALIIVIYAINFADDTIQDQRQDTKQALGQINQLTEVFKSGENNINVEVDDTTELPPGRQNEAKT